MIAAHYTLTELQGLSNTDSHYKTFKANATIRQKAVKDAAQAMGMQAGLANESRKIDAYLDSQSTYLDQIYNFNMLMYKRNILPPVIEANQTSVHIGDNGDDIRIAGKTYRIIRQVKFVTTPPTWRDYLYMHFNDPDIPNKVLLPKDSTEKAIWSQNIAYGWNEGIKQAANIFEIQNSTLERDYEGMVLYKNLMIKHMISPYYISKTYKGITGDGNHMVIDDQNWRITNKPQLQLQSKIWHAPVTKINSVGSQ